LNEINQNLEEKRFQKYLDFAGVLIVVIEADQRVSFINKKGCELLGYNKEDVIGKNWIDNFIPETMRKKVKSVFDELMAGKIEPVEFFENPIITNKGKERIIEWLNIILKDEQGNIYATLSSGLDITERKKAEEKLEHINLVLKAIRNVNQLITTEKNRERLLQEICDNLIETRGYFNAWIALLDNSHNVILTAESGLGDSFLPMVEMLKKGEFSKCSQTALTQSDVFITEEPRLTCLDCSLSRKYEGRAAMVVRLERGEKIFGWLSVSIPRNVVKDEDEQKLFKEVANDIAFALYSIELEEEREKVEKALKERMKELEAFYELSKIVEEPDITEEILIQRIVNMISKSMQYPEITCVRIKLKGQEFKTENFEETKWVLKSDIKIFGELEGIFEIYYLKEKPEIDEGPFIKEEKALIDALTERLGRIIQRMEVEQKLKESEANYHQAFNRAEFYKDIFAHDINNLLQNIKSSMELLSTFKNIPEKSDEVNELTNIIEEQVVRGAKLVLNIRKLSQIEETESSLEHVEVFQVLKEAINFIQKSYHNKEIDIQIDSQFKQGFVQANELLLDLSENILFNAVKHNENPKIEISIIVSKVDRDRKKYLKFEFLDNGIGVSDALKEQLFKDFSSIKSKTKGMGLGLLLVSKILSIYNGQIWVEDKIKGDPSKGSNFIILLPEVI